MMGQKMDIVSMEEEEVSVELSSEPSPSAQLYLSLHTTPMYTWCKSCLSLQAITHLLFSSWLNLSAAYLKLGKIDKALDNSKKVLTVFKESRI